MILGFLKKMGIYDGNQTFYQMDMIPDPKDCTFGRQGRTYDPSQGSVGQTFPVAYPRLPVVIYHDGSGQ